MKLENLFEVTADLPPDADDLKIAGELVKMANRLLDYEAKQRKKGAPSRPAGIAYGDWEPLKRHAKIMNNHSKIAKDLEALAKVYRSAS